MNEDQRRYEERTKEVYLGDGLYAKYDGWMVTLRAPRENGDHWVGLEPAIIGSFVDYLQSLGFVITIRRKHD